MSEEKARSAIDEIFTIAERLEKIEKQLKVMDNNIKILNNKVSKASKQSAPKAEAPRAVAPKATAPKAEPVITARTKDLVIGDIKLYGYIYSKSEQPIKGVNITVYNDSGEIIKEKVSNNDGFWSVRLPPGKYGVEYNHQFGKRKFKPINRTIELTERMKELEVV
jgi:cell wall-associated NlpC family hydrolase